MLGALLELAGEKAQPVKRGLTKPLDESWAEPVVFDGCIAKGQSKPGPAATHPHRPQGRQRTQRQQLRSIVMNTLHDFFFFVYPYICLAVFLMGSLARFDRDQYTWKSDSSQLLTAGQLRWGSNLFHVGMLFLFFGHFVGLLTPHLVYEHFITAGSKQLHGHVFAAASAGLLCFIGLTHAAAPPPLRAAHPHDQSPHQRHRDPGAPVAAAGHWGWAPSRCRLQHLDGSMMMVLADGRSAS